jgi:uncharacterized membrane protein YozB (DUF420 family)
MKPADLPRFWKIYRAIRRAMHRRELLAARANRAAYLAAYLTKEGA